MTVKSDLERSFEHLLTVYQMIPAPFGEYRFAYPRRWRFDFAWPDALVAVELEGGHFVSGRHSRGVGFRQDCDKYNAAVLAGWRVLRFTSDHLANDPAGAIDGLWRLLGRPSLPAPL